MKTAVKKSAIDYDGTGLLLTKSNQDSSISTDLSVSHRSGRLDSLNIYRARRMNDKLNNSLFASLFHKKKRVDNPIKLAQSLTAESGKSKFDRFKNVNKHARDSFAHLREAAARVKYKMKSKLAWKKSPIPLRALFKDLSNKRPQLTNNFDGRRDYDQLQSDYCIRDSAGFVEIGTSKNVSKCRTLNSINEINRTPLLEIGETELRGASLQFQLSSPRHGNAIGDLTHSGSFNRTRKNQNEIGALHGSLPPRPLKDRNLLPPVSYFRQRFVSTWLITTRNGDVLQNLCCLLLYPQSMQPVKLYTAKYGHRRALKDKETLAVDLEEKRVFLRESEIGDVYDKDGRQVQFTWICRNDHESVTTECQKTSEQLGLKERIPTYLNASNLEYSTVTAEPQCDKNGNLNVCHWFSVNQTAKSYQIPPRLYSEAMERILDQVFWIDEDGRFYYSTDKKSHNVMCSADAMSISSNVDNLENRTEIVICLDDQPAKLLKMGMLTIKIKPKLIDRLVENPTV